ncbi:hypothetical protein [Leptospira santarosai]|uniref:Uncharacterized protein n=2 Tax=Leptospira santarosai TaxID=28183 RepID=M6JN33_9LEPT|nr:hypothetical protein [Leptospira santarosai]EMN23121.1 hypothetical protein LEP1GSC063_3253 [Leptospira santarosai serovar Arenal str. MAVJ 401]MDI7230557.1 hypothetical protein [Leptospira santarosai]
MKKKIALVSMLFFVFFCKEENKDVSKQETPVKEEKVQDMKTESIFNWVFAMDGLNTFKESMGIVSKFDEYCLKIDPNVNFFELGIAEGKVYKGAVKERNSESVTIEINGKARKYFIVRYTSITKVETYALMTENYSKKESDGKWNMDSAEGKVSSSQTLSECISDIKLNYELQYHEEDHSVPKKK